MAEKKVSGKTKNKDNKPVRDSSYDDFLAQYGSELRKRSTRTVNEPVRKKDNASEESRCGEINPHTTVNPAIEHQIFTKRTGRILSDDTGFKAKNYNQRFELTPELPEFRDNAVQEELTFSSIPGQQTMADIVSEDVQEEIFVPIEGQIADDEQDPFTAAYKAFRNDTPLDFGKSEKLRAIARTAADDAGMEPESQLSFPVFDPLFKFPDEKPGKKRLTIKKKTKKEKNKTQENISFDIDEKDIVTKSVPEEQAENPPVFSPEEITETQDKKSRFFEFLADSGSSQEVEAPFEIGSKNEIRNVLKTLTNQSRTALIKSCGLVVLSVVLMILLLVIDESKNTLHSVLSLIFMILSGVVCIKELTEGIKDTVKKKLTLSSCILFIFASALIQIVISFISVSGGAILAPAAIIVMTAVTVPKFFLSNNSKLTAGLLASDSVSIFRTASEGGIDGVISEKFTGGKGQLRYSSGAMFATGLMKKLTNAVPKPFGINAAYVMVILFALIAGIASGFISSSVMAGMTAFTGMVITCLPVSYAFTASILLYNTNNNLLKNKSSLISYRCAAEVTETKAIVFNTSDIIEQSACSIHGVKAFGHTDPQKATLYCAAAINAGLSPLAHIMKQVTDQSETEVPEAEDVKIFSSGGIMATVENSTVLLGSREFLKDNGVYIPDEDYEAKFLTGDRKLLYFAMNGKFTMLLIVSYHIKRSVAAFFKYLTSNGIKIVIHSSDPNITPVYIMKKCKLENDTVFETENAEAAYFSDKEKRTETALPADVFTDGSITALSYLIRNAFTLTKIINILPFVIYIMSAVCALLIAAPVFLGSAASIGNVYIVILRIISFAVSIISLKILYKQK